MPEPMTQTRRARRLLSAEQKYEIWLKILTGELTTREAAAQSGVDRSTIMTLRKTAKDGAIAALQASRPGRPREARQASELARLQAENARLSATIVEQAIELAALRGKSTWG
jgi:transposase-like protein